MALPPLQWRRLPVRTVSGQTTTSYFLDTIYDMLTGSLYYDGSPRVIGSNSAWKNTTKFVTGSNTEAVYTFPPTDTEMSQSIIFAGKNYVGASSTAAVPLVTNGDTPDFTVTGRDILMANVKLAPSESFTQWTSLYPFGSSSYSTGYVTLTKCYSFAFPANYNSKITIYESKEAMAVIVSFTNAYCHAVVAGAIIDPEQASTSIDAEVDGRLYAIATSGASATDGSRVSGLNPNFMSFTADTTAVNSGSLFSHSTTAIGAAAHYPKFVGFTPQQQSTFTIMAEKTNVTTIAYPSFSGKVVQIPIKCTGKTNNYYLGRLRDINSVKPFLLNQVITNESNNTIGYAIAAHEYTLPATNVSTVCLPYN